MATIISVIAILGLAHTFGMGRGFIERFAVGRVALGQVRGRMETLTLLPAESESLRVGRSFSYPFNHRGLEVGTVNWKIETYDEPQVAGSTADLKNVVVAAWWGPENQRDTLQIRRLFSP